MSIKIAVTFQQKYSRFGGRDSQHSVFPGITSESFMVFEGKDVADARQKAIELLGNDWAFYYRYANEQGLLDVSFQDDIKQFGLVEFVPPAPAEKKETV